MLLLRSSPSASAFVRICLRRFAHPGAFFMRLAPRRHSVAVAGSIAGEHLLEFVPVDLAVFPMSGGLVQLHARMGDCQAQIFRLRNCSIYEFLPQLVV